MTFGVLARVSASLVLALAVSAPAAGADLRLDMAGGAVPLFRSPQDACDGFDMPDSPARGFRDEQGAITLFALQFRNRPLTGPRLSELRLQCAVALDSALHPDPARYDDRTWIGATWTEDGRVVHALLHHEYQADKHPGRCARATYLECWTNTILQAASVDGGTRFVRPAPPRVVAGFPFPQEAGQGRHRGFFNPSNIVSDGGALYFLAHTTGWEGQPAGACLFRTTDIADPGAWRAWDGRAFTVDFTAPGFSASGGGIPAPVGACAPVGPFPAWVGSVSRHRPTNRWVAVFPAAADGRRFAVSGFHYSTSDDLIAWTPPRPLLEGRTLFEDPCGSTGRLLFYPSLIDEGAEGRNFDNVGDEARLLYAVLDTVGCEVTERRALMMETVRISVQPR